MKSFIFSIALMVMALASSSQEIMQPKELSSTQEHQIALEFFAEDVRDAVYDYIWEYHHNKDSVALQIGHFTKDVEHLPYCFMATNVIGEALEELNDDECNFGNCNSIQIIMSRTVENAPFNISIEFDMEHTNKGISLNIWAIIENNGHEGFFTGSILPPMVNKEFLIKDEEMEELFE